MSNPNEVKNQENDRFENIIITDTGYPEVSLTVVHFLDDEIQIEQGRGAGEVDLADEDNAIVSISPSQARKLAEYILARLN